MTQPDQFNDVRTIEQNIKRSHIKKGFIGLSLVAVAFLIWGITAVWQMSVQIETLSKQVNEMSTPVMKMQDGKIITLKDILGDYINRIQQQAQVPANN